MTASPFTMLLASALAVSLGGCAHPARDASALPTRALLAASEHPALYLGAAPNAAQIGYVSDDAVLLVDGAARDGRVHVRIEGALTTSGYVPVDQLSLRVQHRGRVRGTPTYVAPDDRVRVLGPDTEPDRLRVEVTPRLGARVLGRFEGSYPREGLAVEHAARDAEPPAAGVRYRVPAQLGVVLVEQPPGLGAAVPAQVAELAPQSEPYDVTVVRAADGWLAVRAGGGPYLIGWTNAPLVPVPTSDGIALPKTTPTADGVPTRLANERGALRRVAAGTEVKFGDVVIGRFQQPGFARVQQEFAGGYVDVFAAVNDDVALRGVVRAEALSEQAAVSTQ